MVRMIIDIDDCERDCPNFYREGGDYFKRRSFCKLTDRQIEGKTWYPTISSIPEWCPLRKNDKEKKSK